MQNLFEVKKKICINKWHQKQYLMWPEIYQSEKALEFVKEKRGCRISLLKALYVDSSFSPSASRLAVTPYL